MGNFFKYLINYLLTFFGFIGAAAITPEGIITVLGIFIVAMVIYILHLIISKLDNKLQLISSSIAGLLTAIISVAKMYG